MNGETILRNNGSRARRRLQTIFQYNNQWGEWNNSNHCPCEGLQSKWKSYPKNPQKQGTYPDIFETTTWAVIPFLVVYCQISKNFVLSHPLVTTCAETPERQKNKIWKQHHHHREKQFPGAAGTQDSRQILRGVNIVWSKELSTRTSCFVLAKLNISFFMPLARIQNIIDTLVKMGCLFPQRRATSWHQHGYSILSCSEL